MKNTTLFKQAEHGRSMVEILGVLAIIGVLSIGGIQGYTYAMNKYRANNILNEINIASHQLATVLLTKETEEITLSLGNPYDLGRITSAEYPFNYGCGNGLSEDDCTVDETGYWMTLNGVPEKICQHMLSDSGFLPYLAEQQLNDNIVTDGVKCTAENNEIVFLFNSDGSGELAENAGGGNGNDNNDDDEPEVPTITCPANTSEDGQGALATTVTDETTGRVIQCYCVDVDTKYTDEGTCETLPETCNKNADCNRGEYCDITDYGGNKCTKDTSGMKGTCRNAISDVKTPNSGTNPPFVMSSRAMYWWSAVNFCEALGKTLVEVSDYGCAKSYGEGTGSGFCYTTGTSTKTANVQAMYDAYGSYYGGTNTDYSSCTVYRVYFALGDVLNGHYRNYYLFAVCK